MNEQNQNALIIECPNCGTKGRVKASLISPRGRNFVCPKCRSRFHVMNKSASLSNDSPDSSDKESFTKSSPQKPPGAPKLSPDSETNKTAATKASFSKRNRSAEVALCPDCGLFTPVEADRCIHCGSEKKQSHARTAEPHPLFSPPEEEDLYRRKIRYTLELAVLAVLVIVLVALNLPSNIPEGLRSSPVRDLVRVKSEADYEEWTNKYRFHIAGKTSFILYDMKILDKADFKTPYVRRFKKEYLEYIFSEGEYRYSPYTPQQRIVAENPAEFVEVQVHEFKVGPRYVGPVNLSVLNKSSFPLYDLGINIVYEASGGVNRGRKVRGFLLIREPVKPGELTFINNLYHLKSVRSFEGLDKISFYVTGLKVKVEKIEKKRKTVD